MKSFAKTAILFFSRTPKLEARCKWHSFAENEKVAQAFIQLTYNSLAKSNLPVYHVGEKQQRGASFGSRFANAFQQIFDKGYEAVIAVGNDTPGLSEVNWHHVICALSSGKAVLGPDRRGGAYLIGLTKSQFEYSTFESIPWQTRDVFRSLYHLVGNCTLLSKQDDLNSARELLTFITRESCNRHWCRILKHLVSSPEVNAATGTFKSFRYYCADYLRGPPSGHAIRFY